MIWESPLVMGLIDAAIVLAALAVMVVFYRHRRAIRSLHLNVAVTWIILGLSAMALLHAGDIAIMLLLPVLTSPETAMAAMTELHFNWSWFASLFAVACIAFGLFGLMGRLLPRIGESMTHLQAEIEERRRAVAALRDSEARFRDITEASSDWFWEMDENLRFSYFSDDYRDIVGSLPDTLIGTTREESAIPGVDPEVWEAHLADLAAHRSFRDFNFTRTRPDGSPAYLSINGKAIFDDEGNFLGYRGAGRDITAQTRMEHSLRLTQFVIDHTDNAAFWLDRDGRLTFANDTACRMLGYTREELLALNIADIDPDICPGDFGRIWERIKTTGPSTFEARHGTKGGNVIPVEVSLSYMKWGDEELACSFSRDITERKRAEAALNTAHDELERRVEERTRELRESEKRYRELFEESPVGIWEEDWSAVKRMVDQLAQRGVKNWRNFFKQNPRISEEIYELIPITNASHAILDLYGAPDLAALNVMFTATAMPEDDIAVLEILICFIEGKTGYEYEARERKYDGTEIITHNQLVIPPDHRDDWSRVIYAIQDITDRKRAEEALRESEARYREIFDESPVGVWEDDWSDIKRMLDDLVAGGVTDLRQYFRDNPDKIKQVYDLNRVVDISSATCELFGAPNKQALIDATRAESETDEELGGRLDSMIAFMAGETEFYYESPDSRLDDTPIVVSNRLTIPPKHRHDWSRVITAIEDITERKRAEKERQASAQRLEDIANAASDWFWEMDADLRVTYISDRYERVTGLAPDHFFGKRLDETYPRSVARDPEIWRPFLDAVRDRKDFRDFVHDDIRRDGLRRVISETGKAIFDEHGVFQGYRGTSTDITERKRAEEALRESEARLTDAIESFPGGFVLYDAEERLVLCNSKYRDFYPSIADILVPGTRLEEIARAAFAADVEGGSAKNVEAWVKKRLKQHRAARGTHEQHLKDGRWLLLSESKTSDGGTVGIRTDITEVKQTEDAIRTRDAWLRGIMENAPLEIVLKDTDGRIMALSRNIVAKLGLSREDYIGCTSADILPAKIAEIYMNADREVMRTGRLVQQEVLEEYDDGSIRHMLNAKFPLRDDKGRILGICSLATDITEMKQVQAQLNQAQKMEVVGQLTGGIAHDFNNLLAVVMGNLELIMDEIEGGGPLNNYLEAAFSAADDAATLTQRLLAFARNQPLMPRVVDMNALVGKMIGLLERTLDSNIVIRCAFADDLSPVSIDPGQLENALLNLVVNARHAMPRGGEIFIETKGLTLAVEVEDSEPRLAPGEYISLTVRDTGDGMPQDVLDHVFEPFFTTKEVGEGSGLGLSMVFGFVKQSGGHVMIDSEPGRGTTVTLYLPATTKEIADQETPDPGAEIQGNGETILFVEDDERVRDVIVEQLTGMGYKVHHARDGKSALDALAEIPAIDLLLSDVNLPGDLNGAELAIEARRRLPALPVLYASGYSAEALMKAGHLEDHAQLIEKPFTRRELAAKIATMLS